MNSEHLLDPALKVLFEQPAFALGRETLAEARANLEQMLAATEPPRIAPQMVRAPGRAGAPDVALRIFRPEAAARPMPAVYYVHGGGFVLGNAAMMDAISAQTAEEQGAVVVAVDYRLAPEAPFPGPIEDCYAGLGWLVANATTLGVDPGRIVVAGNSAGGGLAAALALLARDRGEVRIAGQLLMYPMLDHRAGSDEDAHGNPLTGEFTWTRDDNRFGWSAMRGDYDLDDDRIGHFSPARATDLSGLPPAYIAVGALDLFLDEDLHYALRLARAGVPVECHVYPGATHACERMAPEAAVSRQILEDERRALARLLRG